MEARLRIHCYRTTHFGYATVQSDEPRFQAVVKSTYTLDGHVIRVVQFASASNRFVQQVVPGGQYAITPFRLCQRHSHSDRRDCFAVVAGSGSPAGDHWLHHLRRFVGAGLWRCSRQVRVARRSDR